LSHSDGLSTRIDTLLWHKVLWWIVNTYW